MLGFKLNSYIFAAALAAAPLGLTPAFAATNAEVHPGMKVVGPNGDIVGTVIGVRTDMLILKTAAHEVQLPLTSFTASEGKLLFGMTAAELDAETAKAAEAAAASVAVGAQVYGSDGTLAGQIDALDDSLVTIKLASGDLVRIPRSGVAGSDNGAVLGISTAELTQLATQATASADAPAAEAADTAVADQ